MNNFGYANIEKRYYIETGFKMEEKTMDLFDPNLGEYVLAHCVSLDFAMGAGIAKEFVKRHPDMKQYCRKVVQTEDVEVGDTIRYENEFGIVYNLITKENYWNKPNKDMDYLTYLENLTICLENLKNKMEENKEAKLAIPKIGCGLDRCNWSDVKEIIEEVFENSDIEVLVCSL